MSKWQRIALAVLVVGLCVWMPSHLPSCAPIFPTPLFGYSQRPRLDRKAIFSGRLGVLQPGFDTEYAVAAYFALTGRRFPGAGVTASGEAPDPPTSEPAQWHGPVVQERSLDKQWHTFVNCGNDALRTAAATYDERRTAFGANSKWLADWTSAQDAVFTNCSREGTIPSPVAADAPAMLRADREYQIAAAHFYAMRYDEARRRFLAIAADSQSPWRQIAKVVAARCLIRKVTIAGAPKEMLEQAARELESIGTPGSMALRRYALLQVRPAAAGDDLGKALLDPRQRADFPHLLREYSHARWQVGHLSMGTGSRIDLNRWVSALGYSKASLEGWKANRNPHWLVAALMSVAPSAAEAAELEAEARKVSPSSPAYATVTYHRLRIAIATGRVEQARQDLDALLPALRTQLRASSFNLFLGQRMSIAEDLEAFLRFAPRKPVDVGLHREREMEDPGLLRKIPVQLLDEDSATVLNTGLPASLLREAASRDTLPPFSRQSVLRAAWTRSVLLGQHDGAKQLTAAMEAAYPAAKALLEHYASETDPDAMRFAAAYLMLRYPSLDREVVEGYDRRSLLGVRLSSLEAYRQNWWCGMNPRIDPHPAPFLKAEEAETVLREIGDLQVSGAAPTYLGREAIRWAKAHPEDPRSPEALHLAVRATRYGCTDDQNGEVSKAAFQLLHRQWPKSVWAEKTPYWFR